MSKKAQSSMAILCLLLALVANPTAVASNQPKSQQLQAGQTPDGLSAPEWGSIQQQVRMSKHQAFARDDGSYASANISNGWHIDYGSDGRTTLTPYQPDQADYLISLQFKSLTYEPQPAGQLARQHEYHKPQKISSDKTTLTYEWDDNVKEIWTNSSERLEQWFEIEQRPQGAVPDQPLTLQLALTTDLLVTQIGDALNFANKITYSKLQVWDSTGAGVPARMHLRDNIVSLQVDDRLAIYPLTVDPSFQQQAYLKASNTGADDEFGGSVAISGDTLVVGAEWEDSSATGVNGNETNNLAIDSGSVYVFTRTAGVWSQQAYLKASNTGDSDHFGVSVAVSGDTLVVGADWEDSSATGVNGNEEDNSAGLSGAVYVFTRTAGVWSQQAYLKASNTGADDEFGGSVAISGDTLVVGAEWEDSSATGVNGNETNNLAIDSGSVYVFTRTAGVWSQQAYLKASNTVAYDYFGRSVAVSGDTLVVGANWEDSNATGVNGNEEDNSAAHSGAAYVFTRTAGVWSQQAYLKASNTGADDEFGESVAISGDTLVVGADREDSDATGVNGNQTSDSAENSGAAYVFTRTAGVWSQQAYLKASNSWAFDYFGESVAVSGDTLVVGADREDSSATGVNNNQKDNSASYSGAAYVFTRAAGVWSQQAYLKASNTGADDELGASVAISGDTLVVGAEFESSAITGVNGNQADNSAPDAGAAYVFSVDGAPVCTDDGYESLGGGGTNDLCPGNGIDDGGFQTHSHCDADWVRFFPVTGKTYIFETRNLVGDADTVIELYENCGILLADNDDSGSEYLASKIVWTATSSEPLDLRIAEYLDSYESGEGYDIAVSASNPVFAGTVNTVDDPLNDVGGYSSMAIGSDGLPIISYYDATDGALKVAKCNDVACIGNDETVTTVDDSADYSGLYSSIAIGSDGLPVISYHEWGLDGLGSSFGRLKVAKCDDIACTGNNEIITIIDDGESGLGWFTSIAIDSIGRPVISYSDQSLELGVLKIAKCDNATCTIVDTVVTIPGTGDVGSNTSIAIGSDSWPVVSFFDDTIDGLKILKCDDAACAGDGEVITTLDDDTSPNNYSVGKNSSIAIGSDGFPIVSYTLSGSDWLGPFSSPMMAKCNDPACSGGGESISGLDGLRGSALGPTSIRIGADGMPVIAFTGNSELGLHLQVAKCINIDCTGGNEIVTSVIGTYNKDTSSLSMAIGSDGWPVISIHDETDQSLRVAHCDNMTCANQVSGTTRTVIDNDGEYSSVAIGKDGLPVFAFADPTTKALKVVKCNDVACVGNDETISTVDDPANDVGAYTAIAIGNDGLPVISYTDRTDQALKVAKCNDSACAGGDETITVLEDLASIGRETSIATDSDSLPIISYYDAALYVLKVAKCDDVACTGAGEIISTVDNSADVGWNNSIAMGSDQLPVISYMDYTNKALKVAKCNDPACTGDPATSINTVDDYVSGSLGWDNSIAIGNDGWPIISYSDTFNSTLKVAKCFDLSCSGIGQPTEFSMHKPECSASVYDTSIAIDSNGLPVISFSDEDCFLLTVVKCNDESCEGSNEKTTVVAQSEDVEHKTPIAIGFDDLPVISYDNGFDLSVIHCGAPDCPNNFTVYKAYSDSNTTPVTVTLTCTDGTITANDLIAAPGRPAVFEVTDVLDGMTCTAVESGVPSGYTSDVSDCQDDDPINSSCTIVSSATSLIIIKRVVNDSGGTATVGGFGITSNAGTVSFGSGVTDGANTLKYTTSPLSVNANTPYSLAENNIAGYTEGTWACVGGDNLGGGAFNSGTVTVAPGGTKTCTITNNDEGASLIIVKRVINDNGGNSAVGAFGISTDAGALSFGVGVVDGANTLKYTSNTLSVTANTPYSMTENNIAGYTEGAWTCVGGDNFGGGAYNSGTVTVAPGVTKTCSITNDDEGASLIIVKRVVNDNGGSAAVGAFGINTNAGSLNFGSGASDGTNTLKYTSNTLSVTANTPYSLTENNIAGYTEGTWTCVGGDNLGGGPFNSGTVTVAPGDTKTCTITNNDDGASLIIVKRIVNDNGGTATVGAFGITTGAGAPSFGGGVADGANTLKYTSTLMGVNANTPYSLSENNVAGYTEGSWTCVGGDNLGGGAYNSGSVTLAPGDTKTCTITNNDDGASLIIVKRVVNDNGGTATVGTFGIKVNGNAVSFGGGVGDGANTLKHTSTTLSVNTNTPYSLVESDVAGYTEGSWTCAGGDNLGGGPFGSGTVTLAAGVTKTCTITNNDVGASLIIVKKVINDEGGSSAVGAFGINTSAGALIFGAGVANGANTLRYTANALSVNANTPYTLKENNIEGYTEGDWTCAGGDYQGGGPFGNGSVTLAAGVTKTCIITNNDVATAPAPPAPPASLTITAISSGSFWVNLNWPASTNATGYEIERREGVSGDWLALATDTSSPFPDTGCLKDKHKKAGTRYYYRIRATNAGGSSGPTSSTPSFLETGTPTGGGTGCGVQGTSSTVETTFGTAAAGLGDGVNGAPLVQFANPQAAVLDGQGRVIVADTDNDRIQVCEGEVCTTFGSFGAGVGQFNGPRAVAVDRQDRIWVADTGNHRLQRCTDVGSCTVVGSSGSGLGQFNTPSGIAVDGSDRILVADTGNNRVQRCEAFGACSAIGTAGTALGQFNAPQGVAAGGNHRIWVADTANHRIQGCTAEGSCTAFGTLGSELGEFDTPTRIGMDADDRIVIADSGNARVQLCTTEGACVDLGRQYIEPAGAGINDHGQVVVADASQQIVELLCLVTVEQVFGGEGSAEGAFAGPQSVATNSLGRTILTDTGNHRIRVCEGSSCSSFGGLGGSLGEFHAPAGIAVDSFDQIIVADTFNDRIQICTDTGTCSAFGTKGTGTGEFDTPTGVAIDSLGRIIIADTENNRIQVCTTGGSCSTFGTTGTNTGQFNAPWGVAVDDSDQIIISDSGNDRMQICDDGGSCTAFGTTGTSEGAFIQPRGVALDLKGKIIVSDSNNNRLQVCDDQGACSAFGLQGSEPGQYALPSGLAIDNQGGIIVADTDNHRIQVLRRCAPTERVFREGFEE